MASKTINISIPEELIKAIDEAAKNEYASRSDFIRETMVRRLKGQRIVDEWGDEGSWKTVADFRDLPGGGMELDEFIARLENLDGQDK